MNIGFLYRLVHEKCVNYHEIKFLVASLFGICYVQIQNTICFYRSVCYNIYEITY